MIEFSKKKRILAETDVKRAIKMWKIGNEWGNADFLEEAADQLGVHKNKFPLAMYYGAVINIQIRNDNMEKHLKDLISSLGFLLQDIDIPDNKQLIASCKEILLYLAEKDNIFDISESPIKNTSIGNIQEIISDIRKHGATKPLLNELYCHLDCLCG